MPPLLLAQPLVTALDGARRAPDGVWHAHPSVVLGALALLGGYLWLIGPGRARFAASAPVSRWRVAAFVAGVAVMVAALTGPIHAYGDCCLFTVHMLQHVLVTLVMPPLLLLGAPGWAVRPLARMRAIGPLGRWATSPLRAFLLFNAVFVGSHVVPVYELQMRSHGFHVALHLAFMVTATITWWPVCGPADVPGWPRLAPPVAMLYLFVQSLPGTLLGAILGLAPEPLYAWYVEAPRVSSWSALFDQQFGSLMMWVAGGFYWYGALATVYFVWAAQEEREEAARG
jgi:putative membrane protein